MTQSAHQGKQIHLGWARIHQRWQKNVPQNQHWTVAFLNLKNIKMLLRKVCARWNRSHRFPGVSHLQELHCKTLGWVSVVQQCKFNRPLVLHTTSIYTIDWFPGKHLLSQLSFSKNRFHVNYDCNFHFFKITFTLYFSQIIEELPGRASIKTFTFCLKKHFNFFNSRIIDRLQGGLPEADGTVVVDHSLGDAAPWVDFKDTFKKSSCPSIGNCQIMEDGTL